MAHEEKLPWDLTEEILSRTSPKSLVRFRAVSKQWNNLFNDKTFISKYKQTFQFILKTKSEIYSVSINPKIVVHELTLDSKSDMLELTLGLQSEVPKNLFDCNGFLLCEMNKGAVVWNPSLNQTRWFQPEVNQPCLIFQGIGYEKDKESGYKILISYQKESDPTNTCYKIHDFVSNTLKDHNSVSSGSTSVETKRFCFSLTTNGISLNGSLYWVVSYVSDPSLGVVYFDFLQENFFVYCDLPCEKKHIRDALVLRAFGGDRLSLLKQCHLSKKVEIWVTKNKVLKGYVKNVEWMKLMEVLSPNFPDLVQAGSDSQPSYFIEDKKLVVCSCDETGQAWIYVAVDNKLISQIRIDSIVDPWPLHCTYSPSLISVPDQVQRGDEEMQV